jgi:hypothetical protein
VVQTALRYQNCAEELRIIASSMRDPLVSGFLLTVARDYDRMAQWMKEIESAMPETENEAAPARSRNLVSGL